MSEKFLLSIAVDYWRLWLVVNINDSKKFTTYPRIIPQTPTQHEGVFESFAGKRGCWEYVPGVCWGCVTEWYVHWKNIFTQGHQEPLHQKMCQSQKEIDPILLPKNTQDVLHFPPPWALISVIPPYHFLWNPITIHPIYRDLWLASKIGMNQTQVFIAWKMWGCGKSPFFNPSILVSSLFVWLRSIPPSRHFLLQIGHRKWSRPCAPPPPKIKRECRLKFQVETRSTFQAPVFLLGDLWKDRRKLA